jgi:hypothetical protein
VRLNVGALLMVASWYKLRIFATSHVIRISLGNY